MGGLGWDWLRQSCPFLVYPHATEWESKDPNPQETIWVWEAGFKNHWFWRIWIWLGWAALSSLLSYTQSTSFILPHKCVLPPSFLFSVETPTIQSVSCHDAWKSVLVPVLLHRLSSQLLWQLFNSLPAFKLWNFLRDFSEGIQSFQMAHPIIIC